MKLWSMLLGLAVALVLTTGLTATDKKEDGEKKEVTIKGSLVCGKCTLKITDECSNVIQVKEKDGDKEVTVNYFIVDKGKPEKYHQCPAKSSKEVTAAVGTVEVKDKMKYITLTKPLEFAKDKDKDK